MSIKYPPKTPRRENSETPVLPRRTEIKNFADISALFLCQWARLGLSLRLRLCLQYEAAFTLCAGGQMAAPLLPLSANCGSSVAAQAGFSDASTGKLPCPA